MPDYWSVPIDNSLYMGLDSQIAKGPDFFVGSASVCRTHIGLARRRNTRTGIRTAFPEWPAAGCTNGEHVDYNAIGNIVGEGRRLGAEIPAAVGMAAIPDGAAGASGQLRSDHA